MQIHSSDIPAATETLDRLGDEIAELSAHLDAATAQLLDLIRDFDARAGWNTGFRSCAAWLVRRVGLDPGAARERVRVARALGTLPLLRLALARGEVSYAKVRALTRVATPETEERLLAVAKSGTAAHVERIVRGWRQVDRQAEAHETARQHAGRALHVYQDEDGTVVIRGRLAPEIGALLTQALTAAREHLYRHGGGEDASTVAQQQADALALLVETALHHGVDPGVPAERYQVVVHVDARAGRSRSAGPVGPRGWGARFCRNVAPPGVRREPGRDAARPRRPRRGNWSAHARDPAVAAPCAAASRPRLPLPGL
jgi:hypothetical protein